MKASLTLMLPPQVWLRGGDQLHLGVHPREPGDHASRRSLRPQVYPSPQSFQSYKVGKLSQLSRGDHVIMAPQKVTTAYKSYLQVI